MPVPEHFLHVAWIFAAFLGLVFSSFLIYRQKTMSRNTRLVKSSLNIFVLLLSFSMLIEMAHHLSMAVEVELDLLHSVFMPVNLIAFIFLINAISAPFAYPNAGSQMELFRLELSKPRIVSLLNLGALATAFIAFLPGAMVADGTPVSVWYASILNVIAISMIIVLAFYFGKHMSITGRRRVVGAIWGGAMGIVVLQLYHFYLEQWHVWSELFSLLYLGVGALGALISIPFIPTLLKEKQIFDQFFLGYPTPSITAGEDKLRDVFSKNLGLSRKQLGGRKILLEFDPASNYEKTIKDFATEASANAEKTVLFTRKESPVYSALNTQATVKFLLTPLISVPTTGASENEMLLPANNTPLILEALFRTLKTHSASSISIIFDNLSDLILTIGFEKTYSFMRYVIDLLASTKVTALLLLNPSAHDPKVVSSLRGLFSNQIAYGKEGIRAVK